MAPLPLMDERLLVWVDPVAPVVFTEPQPKPLGRIQHRGIGRQEQRRYSSGPLELLGGMPARSVQHHDSVLAWAKFSGCCVQDLLHGRGIRFSVWTDHRPPSRWIDDAEHPDRLPPVLSHDRGPRSLDGPYRRQCSLLSESCFVLKPDANPGARPGGPHAVHKKGARRLKALAAAGSCLGCLGRGLRQTKP